MSIKSRQASNTAALKDSNVIGVLMPRKAGSHIYAAREFRIHTLRLLQLGISGKVPFGSEARKFCISMFHKV